MNHSTISSLTSPRMELDERLTKGPGLCSGALWFFKSWPACPQPAGAEISPKTVDSAFDP